MPTAETSRPAMMRREDGGYDEVEFFGGADRLFACRHVPAGTVRGGLVVCSPILSDFGANYQREVRLGRLLAARGVAVQRYHPRGAGQSDGRAEELTLTTLVDDALAALTLLRERCAVDRVGFLGTRFGALAAAAAAADVDGAPIVFWEPTTDTRQFVREGLRARAVHAVGRDGAAPEDPHAELVRRGFVDLLGIPVGQGLFQTAADLPSQLGRRPRPLLLVQLERGDALRAAYCQLVERWSNDGFDVTARLCPCDESWWYVHDRLSPADQLLATTIDWLVARWS